MKRDATERAPQLQEETAPIVVIGYGNSLRRDDGAGPLFAETLAHYWSGQGIAARAITSTQLLPEMASEIAACEVETLIFVDSEAQAATSDLQILQVELNDSSPSLGHHMTPATLLLYAALLYGRYPQAWLVTIPGLDFAHGQGLSEQVNHLLEDVPVLATQLLNMMTTHSVERI